MTIYTHERYNQLAEQTFDEIRKLAELKGGEYAGDGDRLANFRRNALDQGLPMETIWRVYAAKHWDAIGQYCKDRLTGKSRDRLESISGRADDLITYLILFKAMVEEHESGRNVDCDIPLPVDYGPTGLARELGHVADVLRVCNR